jgi:glycosyltransferase involved in cell wall biosynthesis
LVSALIKCGRRVVVICYYENDPGIVSRFEAAGARVELLERERRKPLELLQLVLSLRRWFSNERTNVVHVQYMAPGLAPILAARLAGVKHILATVHQTADLYGWMPKAMLRFGARFCVHFLCVSDAVQKSWFGSQFKITDEGSAIGPVTVYNGVDLSTIRSVAETKSPLSLRQKIGVDEDRFLIGAVMRLVPVKGSDFLIHILSSIECQHWTAVIIGDGPERDALQRLATDFGIDTRIRWLGELPLVDVYAWYHAMDLLLVPSASEGLGLSAVEAGGAGIPVVATDRGGLAEVIVPGENGYLVPYKDVYAAVNCIEKLMGDSDLREQLASGAVDHAARFDMTVFDRHIASLYKNL